MPAQRTSGFDVVIVGGGLAGLAAAVELSSRGAAVALVEQSQKLGGRCYSYVDETTGDVVDNGQHVLIGAYHNTLRYLETIGTRALLKKETTLRLPLFHPEKGRATFEFPPLPKPLHLTAGALKFKLLPLNDRRRLLNVGMELQSPEADLERNLKDLTIDRWLEGLHQSAEARRCVWDPISISVMNELPDRASALLFARSLKRAFLGRKSDSAILLPTVGQSELYVAGAEEFLRIHRVKLAAAAEVRAIVAEGEKPAGVRLKEGDIVHSSNIICAVPHHALGRILPHPWRDFRQFSTLPRIQSSPIVSIHLWFEKDFMDEELIGLIGGRVQWIFNRRKIIGERTKRTGYITGIISAAREFVDLPKEELIRLTLTDIREVFPESRTMSVVHAIVIKEKRATFSPTVGAEGLRPGAETPVEGLYLAGDWTATGLPGTIEGAVSSGFRAASLVR